jgi:hypothetical protein
MFNLKKKLINKLAALVLLSFLGSPLSAEEDKNFKQVEATGRSVVIDGNIEVSRKRALEDALYLAALKGGADVNGFSAINSSTIINDQSVIRATNRVIDFKILNERQDKEFLSIKISAIVGGKKSSKNCTTKPINITFFKGSFINDSSIPSKLSRKTPKWYNAFFDIISELPNVVSINHRHESLEKIIKSNINPSFDYSALVNGLPLIQSGNYSMVTEFKLSENDKDNSFSSYILKISLKIFKGENFKLLTTKNYDLPIRYKIKSNFQFIRSISTLDIDNVDKKVNEHLMDIAHSFLKEFNCRPLEGKLKVTKDGLSVDLGSKQGLKHKQMGLIKGINIKNSMLSNSSVIVHTSKIFENHSILLPLNDNIKISTLNNLIVEFTE